MDDTGMAECLVLDKLWELFKTVAARPLLRPQGEGWRRADGSALAVILFRATSSRG